MAESETIPEVSAGDGLLLGGREVRPSQVQTSLTHPLFPLMAASSPDGLQSLRTHPPTVT